MLRTSEIPQRPMDAYEAANSMMELRPHDEGYNDPVFATYAASILRKNGWTPCGYNDCGEQLWCPPIEKSSNERPAIAFMGNSGFIKAVNSYVASDGSFVYQWIDDKQAMTLNQLLENGWTPLFAVK